MPDGVSLTVEIGDFSKAVAALKRANSKILPGQIARAILFEWLRKIILKWPVDTGRSRAGWTAGAKFVGMQIPKTGKAKELMEGAAASGLKITGEEGRMVIEVINAVSYAEELERGHSRQAPLGAVEISLREIQQQQVPEDVVKAYEFLWELLGKRPGEVEIRASDIRAALKRTGRGPDSGRGPGG